MKSKASEKNKLKGKIIAIDGPAGSGKSTTAKILAERLGYVYLDTGAMYRALTYAASKKNIAPSDAKRLSELARSMPLRFDPSAGQNRVFIGKEDVTKSIRTPEITRMVSEISAHPEVRKAMVEKQKAIGKNGSIVAEGRDTTTVVFPEADVKIYMNATVEERARRRVLDMTAMGVITSVEEQIKEINRRDGLDSGRKHSPLKQASDAVVVDTTNLTIDGEVNRILELLYELVNGEMKILYWTGWTFFRIIATIIFRVKIIGRENVPKGTGFILASNHISYFDPPLVGSCVKREFYFFAKRELFRFKPFGWVLYQVNARPVNRVGVDRAAIDSAIEILKSGNALTVFPEGTRSKTEDFLPVKPGIGMIARQAEAAIVPAYIHGASQLWNCLIGRSRLSVSYGEPISSDWVKSQMMDKEGYLAIADEIMNRIGVLKEKLDSQI